MLNKSIFDFSRIPYFVCIGTIKNKIDMLAPCIGSILKEKGFMVIGTEDDNVHGLNIVKKVKPLADLDKDIYQIIAIDASLGDQFVVVKKEPIKPGTALRKDMPEIGEAHIKVNINYKYNYHEQINMLLDDHVLYEQQTRNISKKIAEEIFHFYTTENTRHGQILKRSMRHANFILQGITQTDTAQLTGCSTATVSNDIKRLEEINLSLYNECCLISKHNQMYGRWR